MIIKKRFPTAELAREYGKKLAEEGKLVTVTYSSYFQDFQVNILEKDKDGILF